MTIDDLCNAILLAFEWYKTKEGDHYWGVALLAIERMETWGRLSI